MTDREARKSLENITTCLKQQRLKNAFDGLASLFTHLQDWLLREQLESLEDTYKTMLRYQIDGIDDPGREKVYHGLLRAVYRLADAAALQVKTVGGNTLFGKKRRNLRYYVDRTPGELVRMLDETAGKAELLELLDEGDAKHQPLKAFGKEQEALGSQVFHTAWLGDAWTSDEKDLWQGVLDREDLYPSAGLLLTGLTLSLLETFDEKKAALLFDAARNGTGDLRERALTGLLLFLRQYDDRLFLYPELTERLPLLADDPACVRRLRSLLLQFILSKDTEKITRKIKDEVIPEMMKAGVKKGDRLNLKDFVNETGTDDRNPEWKDRLEGTGLQDKLNEISEWQLEGMDVMLSSFGHLKGFPFFKDTANWFLPFSTPAEAAGDQLLTQFGRVLEESPGLCHSDKYSFFLSICQMEGEYREAVVRQFTQESGALKEALGSGLPEAAQQIDPRARQYLQDLYRFYKLHPGNEGLEDIFDRAPEFYRVPSVRQLLKDRDSLPVIAEFYFSRNHFREAGDAFELLLADDPNNDMLYQKLGYCLQMLGEPEQALDAYRKAELLNAHSSWTVKKLAHCYRVLHRPQEALPYYKRATQLNPDNLSLLLNTGHCYLDLKEYEAALKCYFKVEYLAEKKEKAWRAIGWCSFLSGKYRQALDHFDKAIASRPVATDYLNAGHVHLDWKNYREALRLDLLATEAGKYTSEGFRVLFSADIPDLIRAGVREADLPFLLEGLLYL
ncbi:MAG: tetratricopeptide repeat protein [Dysgonamonadaceae bacterium]|jgi:tetratricopeptide (TPR) repeat protein|nr:tetratricopeptide repeat protein [Dysgonamonadaceae bacterium]